MGYRGGADVDPGPAARWFCYVLECADGTLYTGIARSLEKRLAMHNRGRASRYTRGRLPVRLLYAEPHPDRSAASRREMQVKKMSRARKRRLAPT
jgi:putative endonuclease